MDLHVFSLVRCLHIPPRYFPSKKASPTDTEASGQSFCARRNNDGDGTGAGTHPEPLVVEPPTRVKRTRKAAVAGGQIKRNGLGAAAGGTSDLSAAFGLRPDVRRASGFEDGPSREKCRGLFIGRTGAAKGKHDGGDSDGDNFDDSGKFVGSSGKSCGGGGRLDPFEDSASPRRDEISAVELTEIDRSDSLDDLDPFRGLQGTLDFNFAESIASAPGLAKSMGLSGKRKVGFTETYRVRKKNNEVSISGSSSEDDDGLERHVVNPLFAGELKRAVTYQRTKSGHV